MEFAFVLTILFALLLPYTHAAAFNCSEPPDLGRFNIHSCCRMPEINLGEVPKKCNTYINALKLQTNIVSGKDNISQNENNKNEKSKSTPIAAEVEYPAYAHACYPECIYRETGAMVKNEFNLENVKKFLNKSVTQGDKDMVPQIVRSFEACLDNIKGHMAAMGIKTYAKLPMGCSPIASIMYSCVNAETFIHCPAKMWKDDQPCNAAKSFAAQCNPLPHVPLPIG
ncbi:PREDICTED: uncharacterized protein LOC108365249 [Rhagoletis zephyria]|uniref:uncharacterized protein LOC108365249 n=1 Tax=Rhagoletis zephyria TaxID=28612 RepID=UPI0008113B49|nr:PREDICTED: uncharacterized protein LOC108365249 [Rhagoletis zephyria]